MATLRSWDGPWLLNYEGTSLGDVMPLPFLPHGFLPSTSVLTFCLDLQKRARLDEAGQEGQQGEHRKLRGGSTNLLGIHGCLSRTQQVGPES